MSTSAIYTYDDLSRKISESINYGSFTLNYSYTYYANGVKESFTGPDGEIISYTYDENNRLTGINIPGQGQITNIYDQAHWNSPAKTMLPGGSSTDYAYDPLMQVKTITAKDPGQNAILTRSYDYSPAGNITAKNTEHGNYAYQYDNLYRLTEAINSSADDEAYTYDLLGNRLTAAGTTGAWDYNANNELQGYDTVSFNYDANGNTTRKTTGTDEVNYIYDTEDRLVRVEDGSSNIVAEYYYDPFGRRLWKNVDGTRTYFLYSDEGLVGEYDSTGAELRTYGYAPDSNWTTDPLFQKSGSIYYWYQNDHLGTPQKITTTSGAVAWAGTYDSFGNVQIGTENVTNNLRFAGQYFDAETGLYYNLNRYYDPSIGRYVRTDPFGQGLNLYAYCFNNPINFTDPMGLCAVKDAWNSVKNYSLWLWRHGYIDVGYTGIAPGKIGPVVNIGIIVSPNGFYVYWGFGFGGGAGFSATVNIGTPPSTGTSVIVTARGGTGVWGGKGSAGSTVGTRQPVGSAGGGWGIGKGWGVVVTHTTRLMSW